MFGSYTTSNRRKTDLNINHYQDNNKTVQLNQPLFATEVEKKQVAMPRARASVNKVESLLRSTPFIEVKNGTRSFFA